MLNQYWNNTWNLNFLFLLHDVIKKSWKNKDKECFPLYFSALKNLQLKTMMLLVAAHCFRFHIVYDIYDLRFFKIHRRETCEGGALE